MSSISGIGGGIASIQFAAEYSARVAVLQKDATEQQGDLALKLIQSASLDTGQNLNISI
jgi:hypothetical protein